MTTPDLWSHVCERFSHDDHEGARMLAHNVVERIEAVLMAAEAGNGHAKAALRIIRDAAHMAADEAE